MASGAKVATANDNKQNATKRKDFAAFSLVVCQLAGNALGIQRKERLQFRGGKISDPGFACGDGQIGETLFLCEHFVDALFESACRHKSIDQYIASLTDAVGAIGSLCLDSRIPP